MLCRKAFLLLLFLLAAIHQLHAAYSTQEWYSRTIYQLMTDRYNDPKGGNCPDLGNYCGGTFQGIIDQLDYIQGMGFDAIWISPPITNTPGGYHGYWAQDFNTINSNFGTAQDLKNLVQACHQRGIWVMVDIVANHVGPIGESYGQITPYNVASDYHTECQVTQYNCFQQNTLDCRLAGLPDLNQTVSSVTSNLYQWIENLMSEYDFDGIRADTVMYIEQEFWTGFTNASKSYIVGEVYADISCNIAYQKEGVPGVLSYPMFFTLRDVFQSGASMNEIQSQVQAYTGFPDVNALGTFIDNHDNARFLYQNTNKGPQYLSAITYVLMSAGIPIIYYGTEQNFDGGNDPQNREILWNNFDTSTDTYTFIAQVVDFRKKAEVWKYPQVQRYSTTNFYAFTRGNSFVALTNQNGGVTITITYQPYSDGTKICNIFSNGGDCLVVQNGQFTVTLGQGLPKIYYPA